MTEGESKWPEHEDLARAVLDLRFANAKKRRFTEIADRLRNNVAPEPVSVRELLRMFGFSRRGRWVSSTIRQELASHGLNTAPDFEATGFDLPVQFVLLQPERVEATEVREPATAYASKVKANECAPITATIGAESVGIGTLLSRATLVSVKPEEAIVVAETLMLVNDFSQLPVMHGPREVRGVVTWRSIGETRRKGLSTGTVTQFMSSEFRVVEASCPIFRALRDLVQHHFVLIRDQFRTISGIVTATDVAGSFGGQFEPFALLGNIENQLRRIISRHFVEHEWRPFVDTDDKHRVVETVADLNFGEYVRVLEVPENWKRLGWNLDRTVVTRALDEVRAVRNDVMHFSPDPITSDDLKRLRTFAEFLAPLP